MSQILSFMGKLRRLLGIVVEDMGTYQLWRVGSPVAFTTGLHEFRLVLRWKGCVCFGTGIASCGQDNRPQAIILG